MGEQDPERLSGFFNVTQHVGDSWGQSSASMILSPVFLLPDTWGLPKCLSSLWVPGHWPHSALDRLLPISPRQAPPVGARSHLCQQEFRDHCHQITIARSRDPRAEGAGQELSVTLEAWPGPRGEVVTLSRAAGFLGEPGGMLPGRQGSCQCRVDRACECMCVRACEHRCVRGDTLTGVCPQLGGEGAGRWGFSSTHFRGHPRERAPVMEPPKVGLGSGFCH